LLAVLQEIEMDSYQAVYDATRSKISGGDVDEAIRSAIRDMNLSHYVDQAMWAYKEAAAEQMRPCILLKPKLSIDGDKWCALYGENLQDGIAGFGKSPSDAMHDFDKQYHTNIDR
jgi:hypothetical protein